MSYNNNNNAPTSSQSSSSICKHVWTVGSVVDGKCYLYCAACGEYRNGEGLPQYKLSDRVIPVHGSGNETLRVVAIGLTSNEKDYMYQCVGPTGNAWFPESELIPAPE